MIFEQMVVGPLQCNCVILACESSLESVVIDPGDEGARIAHRLETLGFKAPTILHTHAHFDHIGGTKQLKSMVGGSICLHEMDATIYRSLPLQGRMFGFEFDEPSPIDKFIEDEEIITFGKHQIEVIHTPGHSPGSVCLKLKGANEMLFSGDTLFQMSIGRTDLWGGDHGALIKSVKERLFVLPSELPVYPGHGPSTELGYEKKRNPFFN